MKSPSSRKSVASAPAAAAPDYTRRDFLKGSSVATLMALAGATPLVLPTPVRAEDKRIGTQSGNPLKVAVIGCGTWGRDILNTLARLPSAEVVTVCDTYEAMLKRAKDAAPKATTSTDYKEVLANKDIAAVIIATPSHQHKDIVVAALKAGKQVYCEAPLAHTVEDARAIAAAAKDAPFQYFQSGLSLRSDPQRKFVYDFMRAGAAGKTVKARAQWHKKQSWRRTSPNPDREKELNWRLASATSPGLIGEVSIHALDIIAWYVGGRAKAVTGFGSTILWTDDDRDVPDSVEAVFEFPKGARVTCEATLANSFDGDYEIIYGTDAAVMSRGNKAWMFKEVDAPMLGWEVYARKDTFYKETGIALVAGASKKAPDGEKAGEESPYVGTPLYYGLEAFLYNADVVNGAVKDFIESFGADDKKAMAEALTAASKNNKLAASWRDGFDVTVMALKAAESIQKKQRIEIPASLYEV